MSGKPWSATRSGFEDTTRRRVEVRMTYLGLSHEALGRRIGQADGGPALAGSTVRAYLSGRRAWRRSVPGIEAPEPIVRFAAALDVPVISLEPGGPWGWLVNPPEPFCACGRILSQCDRSRAGCPADGEVRP